MSGSRLTAAVTDAVRQPLMRLGFRKRAGVVFTQEIEPGVLGWLGLNHAYRPGDDILEVNPVIGVRHQQVERLVAEFRGDKFHPYVPPTISQPLNYLGPGGKYNPWLFKQQTDMGDTAADLAAAVSEHGLPFIRSATTLTELGRLIEEGYGFPHQLIYRRPVVQWLAGLKQAALRSVAAELHESRDRSDPAAAEFRRFAEQLERAITS